MQILLHIDISFERTMLIVAERFIVASLIDKYGKHLLYQQRRRNLVSTASMSVSETTASH
jgi:hypothetical protein